ncbi:hypothetical protein [Mastigocladopsis repens]|uniref:hypothetical protein n=1 Tax=Mastigocladopsis repens TaxID=221287 RepID=UPI0002E8A3CC|nr:hypothetical protein [Mastigocladopsis repens]
MQRTQEFICGSLFLCVLHPIANRYKQWIWLAIDAVTREIVGVYRSSITLSIVYPETLTAKGFTQESMFQALCEKLKSKSLTVSMFQILALIFLSAKSWKRANPEP